MSDYHLIKARIDDQPWTVPPVLLRAMLRALSEPTAMNDVRKRTKQVLRDWAETQFEEIVYTSTLMTRPRAGATWTISFALRDEHGDVSNLSMTCRASAQP